MMKDRKTILKPWGKEEILEINDRYLFKKLTMLEGKRCSLQYHENKKETIYVLSGKLKIYLGKSKDELEQKIFLKGETITIKPGVVHRMEGFTKAVYLEASTPEINDVIRLQDDFGRK